MSTQKLLHIYSSIIHNDQKLQTTQVNKQIVVYPYHGIQLSTKGNKILIQILNNMGESQKYYAK